MGGNQSVRTQTIGIFIAALALVGCGGGGGSGVGSGGATTPPAPKAPEVTLTPQATKQFVFSWDDVDGEAEYRLLENPDGLSGYTEVAVIPADAQSYSHPVFLPERVNASYILQACDAAGDCLDFQEVFVTGSLADAVGYVKASNTDAGDYFGGALSISADGTVLAVGAFFEGSASTGVNRAQSDNTQALSGAVYVFRKSDGVWSQEAYVKASNAESGDRFGSSVSLSHDGSVLAVGASHEDSSVSGVNKSESDNFSERSGAAYVFRRVAGEWRQEAYLKASNTNDNDNFGLPLALSGDGATLAVSALSESSSASGVNVNEADNSAVRSGAVYLFSRGPEAWSQQAYIKASNTDAFDRFGSSIDLSENGDILVVGAPGEDSVATNIDGAQGSNSMTASGAAYVFGREEALWSQQAYVKASNTGADDEFGRAVSLSSDGNTFAVGAPGEDSAVTGVNGGGQDDDSVSDSGAVYLFVRDGNFWAQARYLKASLSDAGDQFGGAVSLSGDGSKIAVGAFREDSASGGINGDQVSSAAEWSGAAYLFSRDSGSWLEAAFIKSPNPEPGDSFGGIVLSSDGSTLAASSVFEDSASVGLNGDQTDNSASSSGAVYLY